MDQFKDQGGTVETIDKLLSVTSEGETAKRAVNQLLVAIVGRKCANETDNLKSDPKARIKRSTELLMLEYANAQSLFQDCAPDARRMLAEVQRKLDSLSSLSVLATLLDLIQ